MSAKSDSSFTVSHYSESEPTNAEILIGDTDREQSLSVSARKPLDYTVRMIDGKLVIKAGGEHSLAELVGRLSQMTLEELLGNKKLVITSDLFDDKCNSSIASGTSVRAMSANVMADLSNYDNGAAESGFDFARRAEIFMAALDYYRPTVVGLQEFCSSWYKALKNYHDIDKWSILEFANPNVSGENVYSTVMYRKDLYNLVDSGMTYYSKRNNSRCRCVTWVILSDKTTGKRFCFVSTHWDGGDTENIEPDSVNG